MEQADDNFEDIINASCYLFSIYFNPIKKVHTVQSLGAKIKNQSKIL